MKHLLFVILTLGALTACNPAHEYYVASGERAKDQKKYDAAYAVCYLILRPEADAATSGCKTNTEPCNGWASSILQLSIPYCAVSLSGVPPGEFYNDAL